MIDGVVCMRFRGEGGDPQRRSRRRSFSPAASTEPSQAGPKGGRARRRRSDGVALRRIGPALAAGKTEEESLGPADGEAFLWAYALTYNERRYTFFSAELVEVDPPDADDPEWLPLRVGRIRRKLVWEVPRADGDDDE